MVTLTPTAVEKLKTIRAEKGIQEEGLRIRVAGGGCSGFQYQLAFDNARPGDKVFEQDGVKILVDPKSYLFLNNSEVDYTDSLYGAGFAIKNPNAKSTCGCGQSFSA